MRVASILPDDVLVARYSSFFQLKEIPRDNKLNLEAWN